jgi:O-antigen/teichoic acid export membrane protein
MRWIALIAMKLVLPKIYTELLQHSTVYGLGVILSRVASVLLLPLYTSYLHPADYGVIAILDMTATALGVFVVYGLSSAVNRYHFDVITDDERSIVWWTGLSLAIVTGVLITVPIWIASNEISVVLFGPNVDSGPLYIQLVFAGVPFGAAESVLATFLRTRKWSTLYVWITLCRLMLNIALNMFFLVYLQIGIVGVLTGNLITGVATAVVLSMIFSRNVGSYALSRKLAGKLCRFGGPLVCNALLGMVMHDSNRYFLRTHLDLEQVGLYSLAHAISQGANGVVLIPFHAIWQTAVYELARETSSREMYVQVFKYFFYGTALFALAMALFARDIVQVFAAPNYAASAGLIPVLSLGYVLFGLHGHFSVPVLLEKRTWKSVPVFAVAAACSLIGNALLIPRFGAYGAAWALVITFVILSFGGLWWYRRVEPYDYPFGRCGIIAGCMVVTHIAFQLFCNTGVSTVWRITAAAAISFMWFVFLFGDKLASIVVNFRNSSGPKYGELRVVNAPDDNSCKS